MPSTRQLAAILFTDIAGYTAMMQRDEQSAIKMVKHHRAVLEKTVEEHEGDVIEYLRRWQSMHFYQHHKSHAMCSEYSATASGRTAGSFAHWSAYRRSNI